MSLRILSWNIWFDGNLDKVNSFLENNNADIIGLQEVMQVGGVLQLSKKFIEELGYKYIYAPVFKIQKNGSKVDVGNAIFSKYPILNSKIHNLSKTDNRLAVETTIQIANRQVHVFSTHLIHTHQQRSKVQEEQADNLISILPNENIILMGDFNALPDSEAIQRISAVLRNADPQLLPTWSVYPEGCEVCLPQGILYKLDNIFTTKDIQVTSYQVENSDASDHLPISAIIEI
jgi:endonuclease/exonuclease/phosphatase family metal-dependent hydrolase